MTTAVGQPTAIASAPGVSRTETPNRPATATGLSFQSVLSDAMKNVVADVNSAEAAAQGALTGRVGSREAVDAIMKAERSVQTAIAIREKLVSGYHELSRMQI